MNLFFTKDEAVAMDRETKVPLTIGSYWKDRYRGKHCFYRIHDINANYVFVEVLDDRTNTLFTTVNIFDLDTFPLHKVLYTWSPVIKDEV